MKRNSENGDDRHNSEKRALRPGATTTTTANTAATAVNHLNRSLSSMDERNKEERIDVSRSSGPPVAVVVSSTVVPPHAPPLNYHDYTDDDNSHHHFHPYYHHPQQDYYHAQLQQQHTFPAQVPSEEETITSSSGQHSQKHQLLLVPAGSSRDDDDHENSIDKNIYSETNPKTNIGSGNDDINYNNGNRKDGKCEKGPTNKYEIDKFAYNDKSKSSNENSKAIDGIETHPDNNIDRATSQDYYFDSYAHHAIHEEMLKDEVRTKTYEMAICQNKHLFQDKIVLDVGCGTGILSMFAARAGAKHIYAVDCSSIIVQAQKIININGLSDKITLIRGKVEDIELPVDTVDIIISEWMGYFLLYESMLDTVLFARDKWLVKTNGIIFPDKAVMYITAIEDGNVRRDRFDYWDDVYGFDMSPIKEIALREPVVDVVDAKALVTDGVPILSLDILTCTKEDLDFTSHFKLQALRNDYIHGLVAYFECAFTQIHKPIGFSTSPMARYTHWKQTILYLPEPLTICAGEVLMGEISCRPNERNRRDLDIGLTLTCKGRYSECENKKISYRLR